MMHFLTGIKCVRRAQRSNRSQGAVCLVLIFLVVSLGALPAEARGANYLHYCNERFGFCLAYPGAWAADPSPENGDGRRIQGPNGFQCTASGINNVLDESLDGEMNSQRADFEKITYETKGRNWFVLSGYSGSEIVYRKTFVGKGSINHLFISYPAARKAEYAATVARISQSFKPGNLTIAH